MRSNKIRHAFIAVHAPQAKASEWVNRSVIAAIRSYIRPDLKDWDKTLSQICCALRSPVHSGFGKTPYYMVFGQQMVTSGGTYPLLRSLWLLEDRAIIFNLEDSFPITPRTCVNSSFD